MTEKRTGKFGPHFLQALNILTARIKQIEQERGNLLGAYREGAGLSEGGFDWNEQTGEWTFVPSSPEPAPQEGPKSEPAST